MTEMAGLQGSHPCYSRDFVSPILVRPVREQLEHDRIIRFLQGKFRRRFDVGINPGMEQNTPVGAGPTAVFPDVVLISQDRGRKIETVIEVETVESVNNLESLAEWAPFSRLRPAFHLYVPASMADVAKRLCTDANIPVAEIFSYHWIGDEMRFVSVHKAPADGRKHLQPAAAATKGTKSTKKPKAPKPKPAARKAKSKPARKTSARAPKRK
jgi:hypothetical protein